MSSDVEIAYSPLDDTLDFPGLVEQLRDQPLPDLSFDERMSVFTAISKDVLRPKSKLRANLPRDGLAFFSAFLNPDNFTKIFEREVADLAMFDRFVTLEPRKSLRYVPRGTVGHWVAGNVPLLATFSWAISVAIGNKNIVRLSSRQADVISPLLDFMRAHSTAGELMAATTLVVAFDRDAQSAHETMSAVCDARIAWGGEEAVQAIRSLPTDWECEDIVFGPRASMAYLDPAVLDAAAVERLATDIAMFDQMACSSPQVLFVKSQNDGVGDFAGQLANKMSKVTGQFIRHPLDYAETYRIELDRARSLLRGAQLLRDGANQWTIVIGTAPDDSLDCINRFVQIVPVNGIDEVIPHIPKNVQTCVTRLSEAEFQEFTEQASLAGVCRFPMPGEGNNFENPWDGIGMISRLARSVVRTEPRRAQTDEK